MLLAGGVDAGGMNQRGDARLIQRLLNDERKRQGEPALVIDCIVGPRTIAAVQGYQRRRGLTADGRVDPRGPSLRQLVQGFVGALNAGITYPALPVNAFTTASQDVVNAAIAECLGRLKG